MSNDLRISQNSIRQIAQNNTLYKIYRIPKRNDPNGRKIYHPSKELKVLQYWVVENIVKNLPISSFSSAYEKGNSIKKNALVHKNSRYILHLDIENFFESINEELVENLFKQVENITEEEIALLKNIVLFNDRKNNIKKLVIGSVASPAISNRIMYNVDIDIYNQCILNTEMKYTRYADDIYVSSKKYISDDILNKIDVILKRNGFKLNTKKTHYMSKKGRRVVTGIVLDNNSNKVSLGHTKYKEVKKMIYEYLIKNVPNTKNEMFYKIQGYLALIKDLDESKYISIKNIYKKYDSNNILFYD